MNALDSWYYLSIAIIFGVLGTISMKLSQGLKNWKPTISLFFCYLICFVALTMALKRIDMSIVYAIWSGVGTIIIALVGVAIFDESFSLKKLISLLLIVLGVIGIHLSNVAH
jgi:small multidrug resistance pump